MGPFEEDVAYFAGLFDGEGSTAIVRNRSGNHYRYQLCVSIQMCDREPLDALAVLWGGGVVPATRGKLDRRDTWQWSLWARKAVPFLLAIEPYLRIRSRREKVALAVAFQCQKAAPGGGKRMDLPDYRARQEDYFERMRELNRRGPRLPASAQPEEEK